MGLDTKVGRVNEGIKIEMKVKDEVAQEIKAKMKNALGETTMIFRFEEIGDRLP